MVTGDAGLGVLSLFVLLVGLGAAYWVLFVLSVWVYGWWRRRKAVRDA